MPAIPFFGKSCRIPFTALLFCLFATSAAQAHFLDDPAALTDALAKMRPSLGDHPRVLKIEIDADDITMEVQDPANKAHVDEWTYRLVKLGPVYWPRLSGPNPVQLQLLDPDLEANLFNLDDIDFTATATLESAAIKRANMEDPAGITRMEIARRLYILPKPSTGDVRWTLHLTTGRESADIHASAKGEVTGADLSETRHAQALDLFKEPALISEAAKTFRETVSAKPIVLSVNVERDSVGFITNETDSAIGQIMANMKSNASYIWGLNGLQRRMGQIAIPDVGVMPVQTPFSIDDINWAGIGKLGADALAKVAIANAVVHEMRLERSSRHPGAPVLEWSIDIVDPGGETTKVYADAKGVITDVVLPVSRRPAKPVNWLDPVVMAETISQLNANFPSNTKIIEIVFEDSGGHIVIEDPAKNGQLASFDFTATGVQRASMTISMNHGGERLRLNDLAGMNAARISSLEQAAMKKLASHKKGYLNSFTIGPNVFDLQAGARAVDIYVRDIPVNSAQAHYAWVLYSFEGKYIDGTSF